LLLLAAFAYWPAVRWHLIVWTLIGIAAGWLRIFSPLMNSEMERASAAHVLLASAITILLGMGTARLLTLGSARRASALGCAFVLMLAVISRLLGESVSLSSLDVRAAFRVIDSPVGLPGAVLAAAVIPFAPLFAFALGLLLGCRRWLGNARNFGAFAAGAALCLAGQLGFASACLDQAHQPASFQWAGGAFGLLIREFATIAVLFVTLAAVARLARFRYLSPPSTGTTAQTASITATAFAPR
jgi:hypothetical protein